MAFDPVGLFRFLIITDARPIGLSSGAGADQARHVALFVDAIDASGLRDQVPEPASWANAHYAEVLRAAFGPSGTAPLSEPIPPPAKLR